MRTQGSVALGNLDSLLKGKIPALGIDLGGTKILAAPISEGKAIAEPVREATPSGRDNIIDKLLSLIERFRKDYVLAGVGVATAGIVDPSTGEVLGSTPNIPGWTGTKLKKIIESKTMLPVHVENDANAAAYGEATVRNLKDKKCVMLLTIGTGIGGGILIDGELYRGQHFVAGECGHIRINLDNKRFCACGLFDCWEVYGAGKGLLATAKEVLAGKTKEQSPLAENLGALTNEVLVSAAQKGDLLALQAMRIWHEHLCAGMTTLAHTLDPDCFILAGGLSKFINMDMLKELIRDRTLPRVGENLEIYPSLLDNLAGIVGVAQIVLDRLAASERSLQA
jgi:glucokinase